MKKITKVTASVTKKTKPTSPLTVGNAVFIRTVTHHLTGRVIAVGDHEILLSNAAWIADNGRFAAALAGGVFSEVEPFPDGIVAVGRGALIDACVWPHALPRAVK